jgi:branched-chain amino acid transport system ATP-binding protein
LELIEGIKVTKKFGGLTALNNLDFSLDEGEIVGLIGPNGAGKSTLFNVISGALRPTSGTIRFKNKDITSLKPHQICKLGIGRTFQIPKPFLNMTVYENVWAAALFGCAKGKFSEVKHELSHILEKFGLAEKSMMPASSLTIFLLRMLEIARALSTKPELLLLDEVMAGLNPTETMQLLKIIRGLRDGEGITIFMVEHNMRAIMEVTDRIIALHQGTKIAEGKPEEITKEPSVIEAFLGETYA